MTDPLIQCIAKNVYWVQAPQKGRFPFCHSFVFTGSKTLMIDAGLGDDLMKQVDEYFGVDILLISHSHPDHIFSWTAFEKKHLMLPKETPDSVFDLQKLGQRYTGSKDTGAHWVKAIGEQLNLRALRRPDSRFENGQIIDIGTARIEPIVAPGHLDDHYCFYDHVSGTLITTDIDFSSFGPWYGNPEGDLVRFKKSIEQIMTMDCQRACSSHKPPVETDIKCQFKTFLDCIDRQKNDVFQSIGSGRTLEELVCLSPLYHNRFMDRIIQQVFERNMIREILDDLLEDQRIDKKGTRYFQV